MKSDWTPTAFVLDVDGVMTNGQFFYSAEGKIFKVFGPDDNDALAMLRNKIRIHFVTADKRGFDITCKRIVDDMGYELDLVSSENRLVWIDNKYSASEVIYMGDGIFDDCILRNVGYGIAPANADKRAKQAANFVTTRSGGDRAVAEACTHILDMFFYDGASCRIIDKGY